MHTEIIRKKTREITVGKVKIGGNNPIAIQSMTNTDTSNFHDTLAQIYKLAAAGVDVVRVSCPTEDCIESFKKISHESPVPIIADIHFHYKMAILAVDAGADCIRINPGNIKSEDKIKEIIAACSANNASIRLGINTGSLGNYSDYRGYESVVDMYKKYIKIFEDNNFHNIKISAKSSNIQTMMSAYRAISQISDYPLHLGVTEAGSYNMGTVKSSIGIGGLLAEGIGDTIRVSLADDPVKEVEVAWKILNALGLRLRGMSMVACPSCSRQQFDVIKVTAAIEDQLKDLSTPVTVSILGCVVNGPGEAKFSDIGIAGGGKGRHQLYVLGKPKEIVETDQLIETVVRYANLISQERKS